MKFTAAAALAAALTVYAAPGAHAQNLINPAQVMNGFSANELSALAGELGYTSKSLVFNNGVAGLSISTPEGYQFYVSPTVCNPVCRGLDIYALFGSDAGVPLSAVNQFNAERSMTKAFTASERVVLSRYVIGDFGMPRGNIASEWINFVSIAVTFADFLQGGAGLIADKIEKPDAAPSRAPALEASFAPAGAHQAGAPSPFVDALVASGEARAFKE
ncbi:MAG: hypothetical protein RIC52_04825 [Amphiplicatus sp.]